MAMWRRARARAARAAVAVVLAALAVPAGAQTRGAKPARPAGAIADDAVIALTESNWSKFVKATENMYAITDLDTARYAKDDDDDMSNMTTAQTVAAMAAKLDGIPPVKRAITSAGISTRDYVEVQIAVLHAAVSMMADSVAKMYPGSGGAPAVTDPVKKANLAFITRHQRDLQHLQALEAERKGKEKATEATEPEDPGQEDPAGR